MHTKRPFLIESIQFRFPRQVLFFFLDRVSQVSLFSSLSANPLHALRYLVDGLRACTVAKCQARQMETRGDEFGRKQTQIGIEMRLPSRPTDLDHSRRSIRLATLLPAFPSLAGLPTRKRNVPANCKQLSKLADIKLSLSKAEKPRLKWCLQYCWYFASSSHDEIDSVTLADVIVPFSSSGVTWSLNRLPIDNIELTFAILGHSK